MAVPTGHPPLMEIDMDIKDRLLRCCGTQSEYGQVCRDGNRCSNCFDKLEGWREIERLRGALELGVEMRKAQKIYFKDRNQQNLIASKQAENAFDAAALKQKDSE